MLLENIIQYQDCVLISLAAFRRDQPPSHQPSNSVMIFCKTFNLRKNFDYFMIFSSSFIIHLFLSCSTTLLPSTLMALTG